MIKKSKTFSSQTEHSCQQKKYHPIVSFLISLAVTIVIMGILGFVYFVYNFSLAGGEKLSQIENEHIQKLWISLLILAIAIFVSLLFLRAHKKYTASGILVLPILFVFSTSVYLLQNNFNHTAFDKAIWMQSMYKPEKMAKTLVREKKLIGLTRVQVKDMLGEVSREYGDTGTGYSRIEYLVSNNWTLTILFYKNDVITSELRLPYNGSFWSTR